MINKRGSVKNYENLTLEAVLGSVNLINSLLVVEASDYDAESCITGRVSELREDGSRVFLQAQRYTNRNINMAASHDKSRVYSLSQVYR